MSAAQSAFSTTPPPAGFMVLYDAITPPLTDGDYQLEVSTNVHYNGASGDDGTIAPQERYFSIDGPRFTLPATLVGGVFPPRNGQGSYEENLPHIALARRTLPWERNPELTDSGTSKNPLDSRIPTPWLALLLFEDSECTVTQNVAIRDVVGNDVWHTLGNPGGTCDQVSAPLDLVLSIMPTVEELKLLTHVRQVNVDYKELSAGSSDGFFSVVMSNRLPERGKTYRACLISMEGRSDLLPVEPIEVEDATTGILGTIPRNPNIHDIAGEVRTTQPGLGPGPVQSGPVQGGDVEPVNTQFSGATAQINQHANERMNLADTRLSAATGQVAVTSGPSESRNIPTVGPGSPESAVHAGGEVITNQQAGGYGSVNIPYLLSASMVLLYSWKFTCTPPGTFQDLMQGLDDGMIGTIKQAGHPPLTDTGHLPLDLRDRAGVIEHVWYRSPLVPAVLGRDDFGPYHAADQARRVLPDVAGEDVTYAAAFEVGRLLAMADGRLAQELMRWRRTAFRQAARADTLGRLPPTLLSQLPADVIDRLHTLIVPVLANTLIEHVNAANLPAADAYRLGAVQQAVGLNPIALAPAWGISPEIASQVLGSAPFNVGQVGPGVQTIPGVQGAPGAQVGVTGSVSGVLDSGALNTLLGIHDGVISTLEPGQ